MKRKRILIITSNWTIGGTEKVIKNLSENLSKKLEIELLIFFKKSSNYKSQVFYPYPNSIKTTNIEKENWIRLVISLLNFLSKEKPHIILTVVYPPFLAALILIISKFCIKKSKVIISFHNFFVFENLNIKCFFINLITKLVIKKSDFIITVSFELEKYIRKIFNIPQYKIKTIYNPLINTKEVMNSQEITLDFIKFKDNVKILSVSRLDIVQKDFETLISAFDLVKKKLKKARLIIIGDGPDKNKVKKLIKNKNLIDFAFLIGAKENIWQYMNNGDLFVLSSNFEGLPSTIVEAMACGCPVVATDCPTGPRELIGDNENGILVPQKDPEKMADGILKLLNNKELRQKIIKNGFKKADEFVIEKSIKHYKKLFKKLLTT